MVVIGTGKSGFGPACASAGVAAAPVSASAPDASTVLRSNEVMAFAPVVVQAAKKARVATGL